MATSNAATSAPAVAAGPGRQPRTESGAAQAAQPAQATQPAQTAQASNVTPWRRVFGTAAAPPPVLQAILEASGVRVQVEALDRLSAEANVQRRAFRRELTIANVCLMIAGVLSGLVLATAPAVQEQDPGWWVWLPRAMGMTTLALGALAALHTYKAREGNRLQRWLSARSGAEMARAGLFMTIARGAAKRERDTALAALELINRDLLEEQRSWFRTRASQHRRSSDWTTSWGGLGTALAFIGGSGAVIASFQPDQTWLAVAGVIGAAVGAYAVNRESLRLDTANAGAYEKAAAALDAIAMRYDTVETDVRAGKTEALEAFAVAITEQLSAEHKRWLEGSTQAEAVLSKLDGQLQQLQAGGAAPGSGNGAAGSGGQPPEP